MDGRFGGGGWGLGGTKIRIRWLNGVGTGQVGGESEDYLQ